MAADASRGIPAALRDQTRWLGADKDKDRAVDEAVKRLLSAPLTLEGAAEVALVSMIEMGGMFTIVKVRPKGQLQDEWYQHPKGEVADVASPADIAADGIVIGKV